MAQVISHIKSDRKNYYRFDGGNTMTTRLHKKLAYALSLLTLVTVVLLTHSVSAHADAIADARYNQLLRATALTFVPMDDDMGYYGTAWLVDKNKGWFMTAYHCTEGRREIQLFYPEYHSRGLHTKLESYGRFRSHTAKVIATDKHRDLALVKVNALPSYFEPLKIAKDAPTEGEDVFTLGNPVGLEKVFQFRRCEVIRFGFSAVDTRNTNMTVVGDFLTIQGDVIGGFSGGAMINTRGEVVGVAAAGLNDTKNVGYIAHTELRMFFGLDDRYTRIADPDRPVVGDWIVSVYEDDKRTGQGAFTFTEEGTYRMSKLVDYQRGRYALVEGKLMMRADGHGLEQLDVEWDGRHRFVTNSGDQTFVFERYGTLTMETSQG